MATLPLSPTPKSPQRAQGSLFSLLSESLSIMRYHIMLIATLGMITFSFLMTGKYLFLLSFVVAMDWFLINLMNRITDISEDLKNGILGTERVAEQKNLLILICAFVFLGSFALSHTLWPALTPYRMLVQLIGAGYNYNIVPTPHFLRAGLSHPKHKNAFLSLGRFKEMYFFKNSGSAFLFFLTCFCYPLVATSTPWSLYSVLLVCYFIPFELTFEILYDFRDLKGDSEEAIPTYPVVHGEKRAETLILILLGGSIFVVLGGLLSKQFGIREAGMMIAPVTQFFFYRPRLAKGLTSKDCIWMTHLGSAQLALYLVGTWTWLQCGLPPNIYLSF